MENVKSFDQYLSEQFNFKQVSGTVDIAGGKVSLAKLCYASAFTLVFFTRVGAGKVEILVSATKAVAPSELDNDVKLATEQLTKLSDRLNDLVSKDASEDQVKALLNSYTSMILLKFK